MNLNPKFQVGDSVYCLEKVDKPVYCVHCHSAHRFDTTYVVRGPSMIVSIAYYTDAVLEELSYRFEDPDLFEVSSSLVFETEKEAQGAIPQPAIEPDDASILMHKIRLHQWNPMGHPLTCGVNSNHSPLVPVKNADGTVYLVCPNCDYTQGHIPKLL